MGNICCAKDEYGDMTAAYNKNRDAEERRNANALAEMTKKAETYDREAKQISGSSTWSADSLRKFEINLPFDKISIGGFADKVWQHSIDGKLRYSDFVESMSELKVFKDALKPNTVTSNLLAGEDFTYASQGVTYLHQ